MTKLEKLLIPLFAAVLIGALLLEDLSPHAVRRLALGVGAFLATKRWSSTSSSRSYALTMPTTLW